MYKPVIQAIFWEMYGSDLLIQMLLLSLFTSVRMIFVSGKVLNCE